MDLYEFIKFVKQSSPRYEEPRKNAGDSRLAGDSRPSSGDTNVSSEQQYVIEFRHYLENDKFFRVYHYPTKCPTTYNDFDVNTGLGEPVFDSGNWYLLFETDDYSTQEYLRIYVKSKDCIVVKPRGKEGHVLKLVTKKN